MTVGAGFPKTVPEAFLDVGTLKFLGSSFMYHDATELSELAKAPQQPRPGASPQAYHQGPGFRKAELENPWVTLWGWRVGQEKGQQRLWGLFWWVGVDGGEVASSLWVAVC